MLEDHAGVPSIEEQQKYRALIKAEKAEFIVDKENSKSSKLKRLEAEIREAKE